MKIRLLALLLILGVKATAQLSVNASDNDPCLGEAVTLWATGSDLYSWAPSTQLDTNVGDSVVFSSLTAGSYNLTVFGVDTTVNDTDTAYISIVVHNYPTVTVNSTADANNYICLGSSATLTASAANGATYLWSPSSSLNVDDSMVVVATPTAATTYIVTVTDVYGCTGTQSRVVNVNATPPTVNVVATDTEVCPGVSTTLTATGSGISYVWAPGGSLSSTTQKIVQATPLTTTTYTVTATTNGCSVVDDILIEVLPTPNMSATQSSGGASICLDETDVITVTCDSCISYVWIFPNASLITTATTQVVSPNDPGAIGILIKGTANNDCSSTITVTVNVDSCFVGVPFPPAGIASADMNGFTLTALAEGIKANSIDQIVTFDVFNMSGTQLVSMRDIGNNEIFWSYAEMPTGVYFAVVRTSSEQRVLKFYRD